MPPIKSFRDLDVWRKSMTLAQRCYLVSRCFDRDDQAALGYQLRRSAVSIPSNIAEGSGRRHTAEYVQFLQVAKASNNELQTQLELAARVGALNSMEADALRAEAEEVGRMMHGLIRSLRPLP